MRTLVVSAFFAAALAWAQMPAMNMPVTAEEALRLEETLKKDPADWSARQRLARFFVSRMEMGAMRDQQMQARGAWLEHVAWLIEHRPEAAGEAAAGMGGVQPQQAGRVLELWKAALARRPAEPEVLVSAAMFQTWHDLPASIALLKQARGLGSMRAGSLLAGTYFGIFVAASRADVGAGLRPPINGGLAPEVQKELEASTDVEVYGTTGGWLVCFNRPAPRAEYVALGERLVRRALAAEPANRRWGQALACLEKR
jgi:hypothetical protein